MKVALVGGENLNKWEMQTYEQLPTAYRREGKEINIVAYTTCNHTFDISEINLPIKKLHCWEEFSSRIPGRGGTFLTHNILHKKLGRYSHLLGLEDQLRDIDIAHSAETFNSYSYQCIKAKRNCGCKTVLTVWENIPFVHEENRYSRKIKQEVRGHTDHFIAVTQGAKEALLMEGVPEDKISVIPMGVDLRKFKPGEKNEHLLRRFGLNGNDFIVLFVGQLCREKGVYELLLAARKILSDSGLNSIPIKALIVGGGKEETNLKWLASDLGIANSVRFASVISYQKMPDIFNLANIFVLPSIPTPYWQEQFGYALVEAMACAKPVISTLSGSIPEVVGDAGLLVQPADNLSLYNALRKLILDEDLRSELGYRARKRAEENFDSRKVAQKIKSIYENLYGGV